MSTLSKLLHLSLRHLFLAAEAFLSLLFFRICLLIIPVRKIVAVMGTPQEATPSRPGRGRAIHEVQWAIVAVSRHSPVEFVCFPQALAGLWMLRRRKIVSTLIYGVARSHADKLIAHTWLQVDDQIILGGDVAPQFTALRLQR